MSDRSGIKEELLDLLVDGPTSVAVLYDQLNTHYPKEKEVSVEELVGVLAAMAEARLIRLAKDTEDGLIGIDVEEFASTSSQYPAWLEGRRREDYAFDEVGLWCEILSAGQQAWCGWADQFNHGEVESWTIDDSPEQAFITVQAQSTAVAERAVEAWQALNPGADLRRDTWRMEPLPSFITRAGTVIQDGVKVVCHYTGKLREVGRR